MDWELILGLGRFVLATTLLLLLTVPTAFVIIQMEMKIIAQLALRYGPNRIGPRGVFQSTIHGFKVLAKEDTVPDQADRGTFTLAPWMVYMAAAMSMLVIPFAPGAVAANFNIGIVYFFAVLGLSVVGLLVAGWASYNKYSLLGGLRSAAQMVSYEIPLTLSIVGAVESPRGLYSVYAISDGGPNPYRFRMRDPSFISLQAMPKIMPRRLLADLMAVMASLDPVMGGVDK